MKRKGTVRLGIESLERRDNPSGWSFWDDTYVGAFLSGLGEGAGNIATGASHTVVEMVRTGDDLVTVYSNWDNIDSSHLNSNLFQVAAATAGNPLAASQFDQHLAFGIATLGVGPLAQSGYNAVITGDSKEFSQQAGGFGVMVLVPYAGIKWVNTLPPIRLPVLVYEPGIVLQNAGAPIIQMPGTLAWEWATIGTVSIPVESTGAISGTGIVFSVTINGNTWDGNSGQNGPSNFYELVEQAVQGEWAQRGDLTSDAMSLQDISGPHQVANLDPALGNNQIRYQATFRNEMTGEVIDVSFNYDPTTGQFGTIKPASGR